MKRILSKILPCLLIVLIAVGLVGCNKKYKHPKNSPMVSNPSEVFLTLGNKKLTNEQVYNRLLQTYGLDTLINWMDEILLADTKIEDQTAFEEQMNFIKYGTTDVDSLTLEQKEKAEKNFAESMLSQGYANEAEYTAYYELEYKRYAEGLKAFTKYIEKLDADEDESKHVLTDEDYKIAYKTLYQSNYNVILLIFDSEQEARQILKEKNVDVNNLTFGWVNSETKEKYSLDEVKTIFTSIYEEMGFEGDAVKTYNFLEKTYSNELSKISAVISNKVSTLSTMEDEAKIEDAEKQLHKFYTHAPLVAGNRYYLVLKVSETNVPAEEYANATEEQKAAVKKYLMESLVSSDYLLYNAQLSHVASGVKIYDEALEIAYSKYYNKNAESVGIELTKEQKFNTTKKESKDVVAEITVKGVTHKLTANDLYARLLKHYGHSLALLYTQEYLILSNAKFNTVTDYLNGKVLDKETYNKYYKTDVQKYKDNLKNGAYEADGFPANYGWNQFMVDYLGVASEFELMHVYGSSIYNAAEANYVKSLYMSEEETKGEDGETKTKDQAVQDEMDRIFKDFFSATAVGVYAYYDKDLDGISDEMTEEETKKAKELVDLIYTLAKDYRVEETNGTLAAGLEKAVNEYKASTYFSINHWQNYKKAGLKVALVTSTTYTNTSSVAEEIKAEMRAQWELVKAYKNSEYTTSIDLLGKTLDPGYRKSEGSKVLYVTSQYFGDQREAFVANDSAYRLVITKATAPTYISSSKGEYKPTLQQYESYLKDSSNVSSAVATAIKTYYTTAIANLTKTEIVSDKLFKDCENLIKEETVKFANADMKELVLKIIANSYSEKE